MKSRYVLYYVEGEDEEKLVNTLKNKLGAIRPGKVQKFNVVEHIITDARIRTFSPGTMVVLIFDTDTGQVEILKKNLNKLKQCSHVSEIVTIPQVPNLEAELVRSCKIKNIAELLNSKSNGEFKRDITRVTNLDRKLQEHGFNIDLFWSRKASVPYQDIDNLAAKVKQIK